MANSIPFANGASIKWNDTTLSEGGGIIFISLQHFIAPTLDFMPCLQARSMRSYNKGITQKQGNKRFSPALELCNTQMLVEI